MWRYWWAVIRRAFKDARSAVGHSWLKTTTTLAFTLLGSALLVFMFMEDIKEGWKKIMWALCTLEAELLVILAFFAYHVLAAPRKLQDEAVAAAKEEGKGPQQQASHQLQQAAEENRELRAKVGELEARLRAQQSAFASEKEALQREAAEARNCDPERNMIRDEIQRFISAYRAVLDGYARGERKSPLEIARIDMDAQNYLKQSCPRYTRFTQDYPIRSTSTTGEVMEPHEALSHCKARIARLEEVLKLVG
jgi:hypothetical protein